MTDRGAEPAVLRAGMRMMTGARAGVTATTAMTAVLLGARVLGTARRTPPRAVTEGVVPGVARAPEPVARAATTATHYAFGIVSGATFALVAPHLPGPRVVKGVGFAMVVMVLSYEGWVPAAGLLPPQHRLDRPRAAALVASHLVFGAVLGRLAA
jgi:hypothetical protein